MSEPQRLAVIWSPEARADLRAIDRETALQILYCVDRYLASRNGDVKKLKPPSTEVEADETFVGGKVRNIHKRSKGKISSVNDGNWGKTVVLGLLHRESGEVRAKVSPSRTKRHVHANIKEQVDPLGSALYTDDCRSYDDLPEEFQRRMVNHLSAYVEGRVHTNGIENFWSLLKRTLGGIYVSVDPMDLFR